MAVRVRRALTGISLLAAVIVGPGCGTTDVVDTGPQPPEYGRDGWRKGVEAPDRVEALRGDERVVIRPGSTEDTFVVTVSPKWLPFPTPWGANPVVEFTPAGLVGEHRTYRAVNGAGWDTIRDWYIGWFNFGPGAKVPITDPVRRNIPGLEEPTALP
jgi:hypothetical protein